MKKLFGVMLLLLAGAVYAQEETSAIPPMKDLTGDDLFRVYGQCIATKDQQVVYINQLRAKIVELSSELEKAKKPPLSSAK